MLNATKWDLREELGLERWVSGVTDDEGTEHRSDTGSRSSDSDGSSSGTNELGGGINISGLSGDGERSEKMILVFEPNW